MFPQSWAPMTSPPAPSVKETHNAVPRHLHQGKAPGRQRLRHQYRPVLLGLTDTLANSGRPAGVSCRARHPDLPKSTARSPGDHRSLGPSIVSGRGLAGASSGDRFLRAASSCERFLRAASSRTARSAEPGPSAGRGAFFWMTIPGGAADAACPGRRGQVVVPDGAQRRAGTVLRKGCLFRMTIPGGAADAACPGRRGRQVVVPDGARSAEPGPCSGRDVPIPE